MQVEIIGKKNRTLKTITHNGQVYVEAPQSGAYTIRLRNDTASRRLAVISVDGVNVLDGKSAGIDGQGYVLRPWETIDIPGWRRTDSSVAQFLFTEQGGSYSAQTGKGTNNVGVIGVAVFDEKVVTTVPWFIPPTPVYPVATPVWKYTYSSTTSTTNCPPDSLNFGGQVRLRGRRVDSANTKSMRETANNVVDSLNTGNDHDCVGMFADNERSVECNVNSVFMASAAAAPVDVGTGYGHEAKFHTSSTSFTRATTSPALVVSLRYATRERLKSWGVPIDDVQMAPKAPNPFPASYPAVPAPPGWRG